MSNGTTHLMYVAFFISAMFVLIPVLRSNSPVRRIKFAAIFIIAAFFSCVIDAIMYNLPLAEAMKGKTVTTWSAFGLVFGLFTGIAARELKIQFFKAFRKNKRTTTNKNN